MTQGPKPGRTRTMAIVFAGSLGGVGAHKFYLNRPIWGVIYALFCWTLVPTLISLFEMVVICPRLMCQQAC
jgi:TM2 domain-containing membrane protein YozV